MKGDKAMHDYDWCGTRMRHHGGATSLKINGRRLRASNKMAFKVYCHSVPFVILRACPEPAEGINSAKNPLVRQEILRVLRRPQNDNSYFVRRSKNYSEACSYNPFLGQSGFFRIAGY